jgi:putative metallohydrolase (TIGR04338 family)
MGNVRAGVRDSQRSKLYAAESVVRGQTFESVEAMQAYVDKLIGRAWFKRRWPGVRSIAVRDGRGRRRAGASSFGGYITMPKWSRYEEVVLHEVAHICTDSQYGTREVAAHGWQFAGTLVELVRYETGKDEADKMKASFRKAKVRFSEPKKRKALSPEQKAANAERLSKARSARETAKPVRALAWRETTTERGYGRPYRTYDGGRLVLIGAKTKKAAAEVVGAPYSEFVRDSKWLDGGGYSQAVKNAGVGIEEGEVITLRQRDREWVRVEEVGDGLDLLRDLMAPLTG